MKFARRANPAFSMTVGAQLLERPPDIEVLVDPNPPREVDELELVDVLLLLVLLRPVAVSAVETAVGALRR